MEVVVLITGFILGLFANRNVLNCLVYRVRTLALLASGNTLGALLVCTTVLTHLGSTYRSLCLQLTSGAIVTSG